MLTPSETEQQVSHLRRTLYLLKGLILLGIFFPASDVFARCFTWSESAGRVRAVAIVAHGMNLKPERMGDVTSLLRARGVAVMQVGFHGHCGVEGEYHTVSLEKFLEDARAFHAEARARASREKVPLVLVAYSFSAPVFLRTALSFDRMAFFAPALAAHWWTPPLLAVLSRIPWPVPSVVPEAYRANSHTGAAAFAVLAGLLSDPPRMPPSALVLIDPRDELVNAKEVIGKAREAGARVEEIRVNGGDKHLPIDRAGAGDGEWERISVILPRFLMGR